MLRSLVIVLGVGLAGMGCATTPGGFAGPIEDGGARRDAGVTVDGGAALDGGAGGADGGTAQDGGPAADGGARVDGGVRADGGPGVDGGAPVDGGTGADGGTCPSVTITPASLSAGIACAAPFDLDAVRAIVCGTNPIHPGLYDEALGAHLAEWIIEGDGSGGTVLACRDTQPEARQLIESGQLTELTGCVAETDDYFSFEGRPIGGGAPSYLRVNKCGRWPYITDTPNETMGQLGQVGPPGVTVDNALAAHVAQYLWFTERDARANHYLIGSRPVTGATPGALLCEVERTSTQLIIRELSLTIDRINRSVTRVVRPLATFAACP